MRNLETCNSLTAQLVNNLNLEVDNTFVTKVKTAFLSAIVFPIFAALELLFLCSKRLACWNFAKFSHDQERKSAYQQEARKASFLAKQILKILRTWPQLKIPNSSVQRVNRERTTLSPLRNPQPTLGNPPDLVVKHLLKSLTLKDATSLACVNSQLQHRVTKALVDQLNSGTLQLSEVFKTCPTPELIAKLVGLHGLKVIDLQSYRGNVDDTYIIKLISLLESQNSLSSVHKLVIHWPGISNAIGPHIEKLTHLTSLDLRFCRNLTDAIGTHIEKLINLKTLNLSHCRTLTDAIGPSIEKLINLKTLNLSHCYNLTDAIGPSIEKLTNLKTLDLSGCHHLTDAIGLHIEKRINLT